MLFNGKFQTKLLACFIRLPEIAHKFNNEIEPGIFDDFSHINVCKQFQELFTEYRQLPDRITLEQMCPENLHPLLSKLYTINIKDSRIVAGKLKDFIRFQAVLSSIKRCYEGIQNNDYTNIVDIMSKAVSTGMAEEHIGTYVTKDYGQRLYQYLNPESMKTVPTGFSQLDNIMEGGLSPGELGCIIGATKRGKSFCLVNMAYNLSSVRHSKNVLYYSLEMTEDKVLHRIDKLIMGFYRQKLKSGAKIGDPKSKMHALLEEAMQARHADVEIYAKGRKEEKKSLGAKIYDVFHHRMGRMVTNTGLYPHGDILVKSMPTRTAGYSFFKDHLSKTISMGFRPDVVLVDYADIMKPERRIGEARFEKAGCFEDLRTLAGEMWLPFWTVSQANRAAFKKKTLNIDDIGESFESMQICDAILALCQTEEEKIEKRARFHLCGLRNHESMQMVGLNFDLSLGRITTDESYTEAWKDATYGEKGKKEKNAPKVRKAMKDATKEYYAGKSS